MEPELRGFGQERNVAYASLTAKGRIKRGCLLLTRKPPLGAPLIASQLGGFVPLCDMLGSRNSIQIKVAAID